MLLGSYGLSRFVVHELTRYNAQVLADFAFLLVKVVVARNLENLEHVV